MNADRYIIVALIIVEIMLIARILYLDSVIKSLKRDNISYSMKKATKEISRLSEAMDRLIDREGEKIVENVKKYLDSDD